MSEDSQSRASGDPRVADTMPKDTVAAAAAVICRRGPGYFAALTQQAVGGDPVAAERARRILQIASTTRVPDDLLQRQTDQDRRYGFNVRKLLFTPPGENAVLIGDLWPQLVGDSTSRLESDLRTWLRQYAADLRPGPETLAALRSRARLWSDVRDLRREAEQPATAQAPPILQWAKPGRPAERSVAVASTRRRRWTRLRQS